MSANPTVLDTLIAQQLEQARDMLVTMGNELADDFAIVSRHGEPLQSIDIVGQMLGHLANVIGAEDRTAAISDIGMCELKAKLSRAA